MDKRKILILDGLNEPEDALVERLAQQFEPVTVRSVVRGVALLQKEHFAGVYVSGEHLEKALQAGKILQNDQILEQLPDGVVLLDRDNVIMWANRQIRLWSEFEHIIGERFYEVLGNPDILGPEFCPLHTALYEETATTSILRCNNRYYRLHACPVWDNEQESPEYLVVVVSETTTEVEQQKKLMAIHRAGIELADLTPLELTGMTVEQRVELLKENILHFTQDLLQFDVIEVRLLDPETGALEPLLAHNMRREAAGRKLYAQPKGNGVTGYVAATGESYLCDDTTQDSLYLEGAEGGAQSSLTVPLFFRDEVIGTFNVESPERGAFSQSDLQFLEIFARDVAAALHTFELLAAEKVSTMANSVEVIHREVARPIDEILNDAVMIMEDYIGHDSAVVERLRHILSNARDIKQVIQEVGRNMAPTKALPVPPESKSHPRLRGMRILVVDDDDTVRKAAHDLLERFGCIVETAHNAAEAISMIRCSTSPERPYEAIIADIRLADMSGHQLLIRLQQILKEVPLILMTGFGYDPGHSIVKARQKGLKAVLYKPFRLDQLIETVESLQPVPGKVDEQEP